MGEVKWAETPCVAVFVDGDLEYVVRTMEDAKDCMFDNVLTYIGELLETDDLVVTFDYRRNIHMYEHTRDGKSSTYIYTTQPVPFIRADGFTLR